MGAKAKLRSFRKLLSHARETAQTDAGFRLWDGSTVPDDLPQDAFTISIADEGVVAALIKRPKLETLLNIWVSKRVDLHNGDMFDLVAQRPKVRSREIRRRISKWLTINTARLFQTVATHKQRGPSGLPPTRADLYRPASDPSARDASALRFSFIGCFQLKRIRSRFARFVPERSGGYGCQGQSKIPSQASRACA